MEDGRIDLKKFAPQKANKWYIIKVLVYAFVLGGLIFYLLIQLNNKGGQKLDQTTIEGIKIENEKN